MIALVDPKTWEIKHIDGAGLGTAIKTGLVAIPIPPQDLGDILDSTGTQVRPGIIFPGPLKTYDPWWKYCFDKKRQKKQ